MLEYVGQQDRTLFNPEMTFKGAPGPCAIHTCINRKIHSLGMRGHYRCILCIPMQGPPIGMRQNTKLTLPLFSKINANSVTCQAENVLSELPNEYFCVCCEPHATQLPAGSNSHYPCGIIPPTDRLRLPAHCFLCCSACVSLSSLWSRCICKHLPVTRGNLFCSPMCVRVTDVTLPMRARTSSLSGSLLSRYVCVTFSSTWTR